MPFSSREATAEARSTKLSAICTLFACRMDESRQCRRDKDLAQGVDWAGRGSLPGRAAPDNHRFHSEGDILPYRQARDQDLGQLPLQPAPARPYPLVQVGDVGVGSAAFAQDASSNNDKNTQVVKGPFHIASMLKCQIKLAQQ